MVVARESRDPSASGLALVASPRLIRFGALFNAFRTTPLPVVMGSCFRRDDSFDSIFKQRIIHLAPLAGRGATHLRILAA